MDQVKDIVMDQVKDIHHPMDQAKDIMGAPKKVAKETVMDKVRDIQEDHTKRVVKDIVMDQVKDIHHPMDQAKDIMGAPKKSGKGYSYGPSKGYTRRSNSSYVYRNSLKKV